jgi:hypothetical protein
MKDEAHSFLIAAIFRFRCSPMAPISLRHFFVEVSIARGDVFKPKSTR